MALAKISFEIEVEDTFQNGNKLDAALIYQLLAQVAEQEYDRQFEENKITRRFAFKVTNDEVPVEYDLTATGDDDGEPLEAETPRRKKRTTFAVPTEAAKLFLPR